MNAHQEISQGVIDFNESLTSIPGGTQLFSKRPEIFSPNSWPTYFVKAKGIRVWTKNGKSFFDMAHMGVGSCVLGYSNKAVDRAVIKTIKSGVQSTLISTQEVELAEKLLQIHKWADMARFARSGGEAMTIAVRIARVATGKEKVLFSGYHGWNDWYLAANIINEEHLGKVLLPGLSASGVPKGLAGTAIPFEFNNLPMFEKVFSENKGEIAAIVMEPRRSEPATEGFLQRIRKLCEENGVVLIFDEITTGWRACSGGIHLLGDVIPDLAVFAKAMSNGYAMSAVIGKSSVMSAASSSFISSTNWSERVGPSAAIASIREFEKNEVSEHLSNIGLMVQYGWKHAANSASLDIKVDTLGLPALSSFSFSYPFARALNIEFTEFMLSKGWLAHNQFKPSLAHAPKNVERYIEDVETAFKLLKGRIEYNEKELMEKTLAYPAPSIPRLTR
jgi:glutamate-1-semialdehyde 2,1-aminomutase